MELEPSLERWVEAQILDRAQADRIRQFESEQLPRRRARAGLLPGDVVIKLDGVDINGVDDLIRALDRDRIDRTVKMDVLRIGRLRAVDIHSVGRAPSVRRDAKR